MLNFSWRKALRGLAAPRSKPKQRKASLGRDWRLEDRVVPALLKAPVMPGLATMDLAMVGAIQRAWQVPAGTSTAAWVVGLAPGQSPDGLTAAGANVTAVEFWNGTYIATFAAPQDVAQFGPQLAGMGVFAYPLVPVNNAPRFVPNDPLFPQQWHLRNTGQTGGVAGADVKVVPVWDNFTGSQVVIGIVDDGFQHTHPDLQPNYVSAHSFDFVGNDSNPDGEGSPHGTAVGGVAAGRGSNGLGITGAAPAASLAGLRLLGGSMTDSDEASALSYHRNDIDIYNNSWGPIDIGTIAAPGPLTLAALQTGYATGRNGLGNIFTWAGGNGQGNQDNVNYDGYANSRFVIAVGALDHRGIQSSYSEPGSPLLVSAYSNSSAGMPGITTTDLTGSDGYADGDYTNDFGGTSSATPLVSGVIALMLQANPGLTARDVQHILVRTAGKNHAADPGWSTNKAGLHINHKYGFGVINANAAVAMAANWNSPPAQLQASTPTITVNKPIPNNSTLGVSSSFTVTDNFRLEHVEIVFNATHTNRGNLEIVLTAPSGTKSILAQTHGTDPGDNFTNWVFTTVRNWGESSAGKWTLTVRDTTGADVGTFDSWTLRIYGTEVPPGISGIESTTIPYLENQTVNVTSTLTIVPNGGNTITSARVFVSSNFDPGQDVLGVGSPNGLSSSYDANTGNLVISGAGSLAQYQNALRSVRYSNLSEHPISAPRTVSFQITDSKGNGSNTLSRNISVFPVNDAPTFIGGGDVAVDEDSGVQFIPGWATDILAGPAEEVQSLQQASMEIVSYTNAGLFSFPPYVSPTGDLQFAPAANASGTSTVLVRARDNGGTANGGINASPAQSFQITINPLNDAPISEPDRFVVSEDSVMNVFAPGVLANDRDMEANPMTAIKLTDPANGSITFSSNGAFNYTPDPDFTGNDSFTYRATDGLLQSFPVTVTLAVAPRNDAPSATNDSTSSDGRPVVIPVVGNDSDLDGDILRVSSYTRPTIGRVTRAGNSLVYTPNPGAVGVDTFNYTIADGKGGTDTATITVNVTDAIAPVVQAVRLTYGTGTTAVIDLASFNRNTLPWANITKFQFIFSEDVTVDQSALTLTGGAGGALTLNFAYDPATRTATWSRPTGLPIDRYTLELDGSLITDGTSNTILGTWAKAFAVLPGDFDGNGVVDDVDLTGIQSNFTSPIKAFNRWADVNGNGIVDGTDLSAAVGNKGKRA